MFTHNTISEGVDYEAGLPTRWLHTGVIVLDLEYLELASPVMGYNLQQVPSSRVALIQADQGIVWLASNQIRLITV